MKKAIIILLSLGVILIIALSISLVVFSSKAKSRVEPVLNAIATPYAIEPFKCSGILEVVCKSPSMPDLIIDLANKNMGNTEEEIRQYVDEQIRQKLSIGTNNGH